MNTIPPDYLGDSVYACVDEGAIFIYTDNGFGPENRICLEPEVIAALVRFINRATQEPQNK